MGEAVSDHCQRQAGKKSTFVLGELSWHVILTMMTRA
jgi:hypothetical protein